ncbi:MAG: hypothetical protein ABI591_02495 [Kofleriaceae bacterium]
MKLAWLLLVVGACAGDIDPEWQLDHTRIVAVRATPPHIVAGATSQIDLLDATKGSMTSTPPPDQVIVVSPTSLADALSGTTVTAPNEDRLAAARLELGLDAGVPVPLQLGIASNGLAATKTVYLGDAAGNPVLANVTIDGAPAPAAGEMITVPPDTDAHLSVDADDSKMIVVWLTSCGTMHDFDLHASYLHVLPDDPQTGELALVVRDLQGGVSWSVWPISAAVSPRRP